MKDNPIMLVTVEFAKDNEFVDEIPDLEDGEIHKVSSSVDGPFRFALHSNDWAQAMTVLSYMEKRDA